MSEVIGHIVKLLHVRLSQKGSSKDALFAPNSKYEYNMFDKTSNFDTDNKTTK